MTNIVPYQSASLPDTTAEPGMPVGNEARLHIASNLLYQIFQTFNGGQAMSKSEVEGLVRIYMDVLTGFEPEAYAIAARMILLERKNSFRLVPAEIREFLEKAEDEHYTNGGQVRKAKVLEYRLRDLLQYGGSGWNSATCGPPPGEPGCRLHEDAIAKRLRAYLTYEHDAVGDWPDDVKTYNRGEAAPHLKHRRRKRVQEVLGLDMLAHATYRAIVVELGIPHTAEAIAAADAEIAAYHAKCEAEAREREARHKAALEEQEAERKEKAERKRMGRLRTIASENAHQSPEVLSAREKLADPQGDDAAVAAVWEAFHAAVEAATSREFERMQSDPDYAASCVAAADAELAAQKAAEESRRRRGMELLRVQREAREARWAEIARRDRQTTTR